MHMMITKFRSITAVPRQVLGVLAVLCLFASPVNAEPGVQLIMVETEGCEWCEAWHEQIGPVYAKTAEGKFAPLRRVELADPIPADLKGMKPVAFTPTFVVMKDGKEVGRVIGYVGDIFFFPLLDEVLVKIGFEASPKPQIN
jgi:hypothetical protein